MFSRASGTVFVIPIVEVSFPTNSYYSKRNNKLVGFVSIEMNEKETSSVSRLRAR